MARKSAGLKLLIPTTSSRNPVETNTAPAIVPQSANADLLRVPDFTGLKFSPSSPNILENTEDSGYGDREFAIRREKSLSPRILSAAENSMAERVLLEEIRIAQDAIDLFLQNDINGAKSLLETRMGDNMYASVAHSTLLYLQAIMTVTQEDAKAACKALRDTQALCLKRCRSRFSRSKRSEEQVHAELCHAECGLMLSALVVAEDPGLTALVKAGLRFKSSHSTYQTCRGFLGNRDWSNAELRDHFESGVRLGIGAFNLIFSCVPSKQAKYLSIVGFSGNAKVGRQELLHGSSSKSLRSVLCDLVLVGWETYGKIVLGCGICDLDMAEEILEPLTKQYPQGAVLLFLSGRVAQLRGQFSKALDYFERSIAAQIAWKQYQHLCMWESMWCHAFMLDYKKAAELAYFLFKENQWSKTTYAYLTASFILMMDRMEFTTNGEVVTVNAMMKYVIAYKQRIAGHSLPPEKLAEKRCKRLIEQGKELVLPAFEMSYIWGGMTSIANRPDIVEELLSIVNRKIAHILNASGKEKSRIHDDSIYLLKFLRGVCLSYLNRFDDACVLFDELIESEKDLVEDKFLSPHAAVEMAHLKLKMNDLESAYDYCVKAMSFRNYFMQAKLELKIGATLEVIEELQDSLLKNSTKASESLDGEFYTPPDSPTLDEPANPLT